MAAIFRIQTEGDNNIIIIIILNQGCSHPERSNESMLLYRPTSLHPLQGVLPWRCYGDMFDDTLARSSASICESF